MSTLAYTNRLTVVTCCACHIDFAMPNDLYTTRRDDHKSFWCPAGHSQFFSGKSDVEKEREAREAAERLAERRLASMYAARDQAEAAERRRRAAKGQLTKVKNRVANGVCPCCNRTFADLARHMASKHPDYAAAPHDKSPEVADGRPVT